MPTTSCRFPAIFCFCVLIVISSYICSANEEKTTLSPLSPEAQKAFFIGQMLAKHPRLAEQIWNIGFAAMFTGFGRGSGNSTIDPETKKMFFNYVMDKIPDLLKNRNFRNMVKDVSTELSEAFEKSDIAGKTNSSELLSPEVANKVLKNLDIPELLTSGLKNGKPIIDVLRGEDSTMAIKIANQLIDVAPKVLKDTSFQQIKNITIEELKLGYKNLFYDDNLDIGDVLDNSTILFKLVLKHTNFERLLSRSLMAGKPVIDSIRGKDSTGLLLGLGFLAKMYPKVISDDRFQHIKTVAMQHFGKTFHDLNYTKSSLNTNAEQVIKNVISSTNKLKLIQDVLKGASARNVLQKNENDIVSNVCYSDTMDFLDSLVTMAPWSLKMFDSIGKISEGIMNGRLNFVGSYDECLDVKAIIPAGTILGNKTKEHARSFKTKYCRINVDIPQRLIKVDTKGVHVGITWGICVPDSCHSDDVSGMFSLDSVRKSAPFLKDAKIYCFEDEPITRDHSAMIAIGVLSIFGFLIIIGTIVEFVMSERAKRHESWYLDDSYKLESDVGCDVMEIRNSNLTNLYEAKTNKSPVKTDRALPESYMPHAEEYSQNKSRSASRKDTDNTFKQQEVTTQKNSNNTLKRKDNTLVRILTSFAVQTNAKKVMSSTRGDNSISCIHGIRFLSITWILLGHTFNYGFVSASGIWTMYNPFTTVSWVQRFTFQATISAALAVDSFYLISGMLVIYLQVKQVTKLKKDSKLVSKAMYVGNYIFHRVWRLTPLYMMILMIFTCLMKYFGDGPFWTSDIPSAEQCKTTWWANLLYINNFLPHDDQCMTWSWFLSNDMQFYIITLIFLGILAISVVAGIVSISILMVAGISAAAYAEYTFTGDILSVKGDGNAYWDNVYIPPWCRVSSYCVGMLLGVLLLKRPRQKLNWIVASVGWIVAAAAALIVVYIPYTERKKGTEPWSLGVHTLYESLGRPLWSVCVGWVIYACHNGSGGFVNSLLSWRGLLPFSRMSYAAYLIHPIVMMTYVYSRRTLVYMSDYNMIYLFFGHTVMTFMASFVASVMFEAPFMSLEKIITRR